jgi:hypothetical protein
VAEHFAFSVTTMIDRHDQRPAARKRGVTLGGCIVVALLTAVGCAKSDSNIAHVDGIVRLNGEPLQWGRVIFQPMGAGQNALGEIGPDGTFTLATGAVKGARIGEHQVAVIAAEKGAGRPDPTAGRKPLKYIVPERYIATGTSGLTYEVKPGDNHAEIDLESP